MPHTPLLPPFLAIRTVWARTGIFTNDEHSQNLAAETAAAWNSITARARAMGGSEEKYVNLALLTMEASLRSLDTVYKGREINFQENQELRRGYLDSVKQSLEFGEKAKDFLKSLPTMVIGSAGGVTVAQALNKNLSELQLWGIGLVLAGAGYLVNFGIVRAVRKRTQMLYVIQDYERSLYYDQYISRVAAILKTLYLDLQRIHKGVYGNEYPLDASVDGIISELLQGIKSPFCCYTHKHMAEKKITPGLWSRCESGVDKAIRACPFWEGS